VLAGVVLVAELVIREALIYIVVALAPLIFATRLWPATKGAASKLLELLCALIVSKLVIAVALAVAAAAAVGTGSGGEVTSLPTPEVYAQNSGGSVTQAVGILLAAAAAFGVAAFSPMLIARLLPLTEAAVVAQGVRGGPMRAGQQSLMMANSAQMGGRRISQMASGKIGSGAVGAGTGSGPAAVGAGGAGAGGAGAASAGAAAAGPAGIAAAATLAAAKAVKGAASAGAGAATATAESATGSSAADRPITSRGQRGSSGSPPQSPPSDKSTSASAPKHPGASKGTPGGH